jgi:tetratricopeptide (TPR) repeat protein
VRDQPDSEDWNLLLTRALLDTGQYPAALTTITNALERRPWSVRLRWQAREVFLSNGRTNAAAKTIAEIIPIVGRNPSDYRDTLNLVAFGQAALLAGADPKQVLDKVYTPAKKSDPKLREIYLASGALALDKHDFARAAREFQDGLKQLPDDPDLNFGLAQAYEPGDQALMVASLEAALEQNSNHVGCLLLLADHSIDAEDYEQAAKLLDRIKAVNPWHPEAWAYRAVLAHLQNQPPAEETARQNALKFWPSNPLVDHTIGKKLSQNYRFVEGADHQRQALKFDPDYLPAKAQLAQDLLRLGNETEGWALAEAVQKQDGYDVEAYNLATLHDTMKKFTAVTNADFIVRMSSPEAALYGPRVLDLLTRAKSNLVVKYGFEIQRPTIVEVFPEQKDFAVRTFGMPGNPGYLGVCFGNLITANSPAAQRSMPVNWQAVLWHEFCHVVTLQMTRNKMPRWLSEGISVYEERQANPSWGEHMNPQYRELALGDELTPISKLSGAFLSPRSEMHLQFAYYESSIVVEFLVQHYGLDHLKAILHDLGEGVEINQAIEKNTESMEKLEKDFVTFAHEQAENLGPGLDWEKPEFAAAQGGRGRGRGRGQSPNPRSGTNTLVVIRPYDTVTNVLSGRGTNAQTWESFAREHPTNFWAMTHVVAQLIEARQWEDAKPLLKRLIELYPDFTGPESTYRMLGAAYRALGETNAERQVLTQLAERDDAATDVYLRLMQLGAEAKDWPAVLLNAQRFLAVNPLVPPPYRYLAQAGEGTGQPQPVIQAYRALLQLDPPDPAEVNFHLADALHHEKDPAARRYVLQALEEAPRYREALNLLVKINEESPQPSPAPNPSNTAPPK